MDSFGGDWSPFAVFYDPEEAIELQEMLKADADSTVVPAPYYEDKQAVGDDERSSPPAGLEEVSVAFAGSDDVAVSDNSWATREYCYENGGLRGVEQIFETAEDVVEERPSAVGEFIVSEMSAEQVLEVLNS
jgi:hypothetical protein